MTHLTMYNWITEFKRDHMSIADVHSSGRIVYMNTLEIIGKKQVTLLSERRIKFRKIVEVTFQKVWSLQFCIINWI